MNMYFIIRISVAKMCAVKVTAFLCTLCTWIITFYLRVLMLPYSLFLHSVTVIMRFGLSDHNRRIDRILRRPLQCINTVYVERIKLVLSITNYVILESGILKLAHVFVIVCSDMT
jgi:hypothetical protein